MYAVIALGGKQYRVTKGERLVVDRLSGAEGSTVTPPVVLASDGKQTLATESELKPVKVSLKVKEHMLGPKITVRTYRAKKSSSRRLGYRSRQTVVEVESIAFGGSGGERKAAADAPAAEKKPAARKPAAAKKPAAEKKPAARKPAAKKAEEA